MAPIINAQRISKSFGAAPLFEEISFTVSEGDRIALIGPNGSGKSTLLRILAGHLEPDAGEVATRKRTQLAYVEQQSDFPAGATVRAVIAAALERAQVPEAERERRLVESLGRVFSSKTARQQFSTEDSSAPETFNTLAASLSGGWRKRLAIVEALVQQPDVLLLDEPTNHLDLEGIEWLEELLASAGFACVVVSHDRYFLENVASATVELSRAYPEGLLLVPGNYSAFLEKKEEFLHAQARRQESLENRVRNELAWLRRGAKARTRKAKARIDRAHQLMAELGDLNSRSRNVNETAAIDFSATDRKTKRLIELEGVSYWVPAAPAGAAIPDGAEAAQAGSPGAEPTQAAPAPGARACVLFRDLNFLLTAGKRVGLVGPNGSGKTTLLRLLRGEIAPTTGQIRRAEFLRIVYFDQNRPLDPEATLRRALAPEGDSVIYQERVIHVASWASRFLFTSEQLNQPVERLSGGERARVLIAQLMLQPADVLLLDEPTNDLDIPTLEILEESLLEFPGALVLVTHDRYMLDRISSVVLGLDGTGAAGLFADYSQCEAWLAQQSESPHLQGESPGLYGRGREAKGSPGLQPGDEAKGSKAGQQEANPSGANKGKKKLSYLEAREYATLEPRIAQAEELLRQKRAAAEDPSIASDAAGLLHAHAELEQAQKEVDELYAKWAELESKLS